MERCFSIALSSCCCSFPVYSRSTFLADPTTQSLKNKIICKNVQSVERMQQLLDKSHKGASRLESLADKLSSIQRPSDMISYANPNFVYLPELVCSLPLKLHPDYEKVKHTVDEWVSNAIEIKKESDLEFITQWRVPLAMCLGNPEAFCERLILSTKMMVLMGLADDVLDEMSGERVSGQAICAALDGKCQIKKVGRRAEMRAFCKLWEELKEQMSSLQKQRFVQSMEEGMQVLQTMDYLRQSDCSPTVDSYIELRRMSGGIFPTFVLQEFSLGMEKDEEAIDSDLLKQLEAVAGDHIVWVNDLLSFRKEYVKGYHYNLPSILCLSSECSLQDAIYRTCNMIEEKEIEFIKLHRIFLDSDIAKKKPRLRDYVQSLAYFMSANLHWSFLSARYHGLNNVPRHRHGWLELRPDITVIYGPITSSKSAYGTG